MTTIPTHQPSSQRADAEISTSAVRGLGTGTRFTRVLGIATLVMMGWAVAFGLGFSPADRDQANAVRLMYIHVPTAWVAYLTFAVTALCSGLFLLSKRRSSRLSLGFDHFAGASAEIGVVFMALTLISGSIWGRLTWGVYWAWDARLTTTALLFVTYVGYLAVRNLGGSHIERASRSAIFGLLAVVEIPLVHWSVQLWRSLHQGPSVDAVDTKMDGLMLFSLFVGLIGFTCLFVWLLLHRSRSLALDDMVDDEQLDREIAMRHREGAARSAGPATEGSE